MARDLLNHVPERLLAVIFVGGVVIVAVGASLLVSRRLASWRSRSALRTREFKALADGEHDPVAEGRALAIVAALQAYEPRTATQTTFYGAAADQLNVFLGERDNGVPWPGRRSRPRCLGC